MSTVADELLNDFGSSGDEADGDDDGQLNAANQDENDGGDGDGDGDTMDVDGPNDAQDDAEPDGAGSSRNHAELEDAEMTKARVEKMQLGAVKDVRSVANLMHTLEPVLKVSKLHPLPLFLDGVFTSV